MAKITIEKAVLLTGSNFKKMKKKDSGTRIIRKEKKQELREKRNDTLFLKKGEVYCF